MDRIGMPSVSGVKSSMINYGVGLAGGLVFALSTAFTGSGLLGGLIGAGIAGSVIKGNRGETIATILGFQTILAAASQPTEDASPGVM